MLKIVCETSPIFFLFVWLKKAKSGEKFIKKNFKTKSGQIKVYKLKSKSRKWEEKGFGNIFINYNEKKRLIFVNGKVVEKNIKRRGKWFIFEAIQEVWFNFE